MNIVDRFLNALQNRIETNNFQINDFESKQNQKIKLKNILYTHSILDNKITYEDLISFSDEEIKEIFSSLDNTKSELLFKTYCVYKPLVDMYENIKDKFTGTFEAPQYTEASKWLKDIVEKINNYLDNEPKNNTEYIKNLKEENDYYNKYFTIFNGNELIKPIENLKELNEVLEKINFNAQESYELKKIIGISHIKLLSNSYHITDSSELDKYKVIIKSKKEKYFELYQKLNNENNISIDSDLNKLAEKYETEPYDILQTISTILLERKLNEINKNTKLSIIILELEKILDYSHTLEPKKEDNIETINTDKKSQESNEVINKAQEILLIEKDLVNNIDEEEFSKYLLESIDNDSNEYTKYKIISILLELHTELEKYNNVKVIDEAKETVISNIKDYIETYNKLKEKNK